MPVKVLMPALSPTMKEGNLAKWLVKEGDIVASGQVIAEIETDKATVEFETVDEGKLAKILVPEGTTNVAVNQLIAVLLEENETTEDLKKFLEDDSQGTASNTTKVIEENTEISQINNKHVDTKESALAQSIPTDLGRVDNQKRIIATPLARKIASINNFDLSSIASGSSIDGRIVKRDVQEALNKRNTSTHFTSTADENIKVSQMRKVIAQRLLESKQTIPHFYLSVDCILDNLLEVRRQINESSEEKITINDFVLKAVAFSISKNPKMNVSWQGETIKQHGSIDISVAVAIEDGLITPIVRTANTLSLTAISKTVKELVAKAKENKLSPSEFQGGSFTISNLGMYGVKEFTAIVNPPQSGIIAVGAGIKKPVVVNDQIVVRSVMTLTLSCDHRVIDGAVAACFLRTLQLAIQNPAVML